MATYYWRKKCARSDSDTPVQASFLGKEVASGRERREQRLFSKGREVLVESPLSEGLYGYKTDRDLQGSQSALTKAAQGLRQRLRKETCPKAFGNGRLLRQV